MEQRYYQKEIETMPVEEMKALQSEKLVKQVKRVWENVPYYRNLMEEKGVTPEDIHGIEDLHKLPFLSKADLRDAYPYGLLGAPLKDCVRIHSTSGTTGRRVVAFYTQHDVDLWEDCCARAIMAAGGTEEDVVQVAYGYGLFTGGAGLHGGSHKVGSLTLPMSSVHAGSVRHHSVLYAFLRRLCRRIPERAGHQPRPADAEGGYLRRRALDGGDAPWH